MKREVAIYLRTINRLGPGIRQAEATLSGFRNRVNRDFRRLATALTAALVGASTAAILVGANFEQAMANVGSVARATDAEMVQLENRARELGATTAYSASQAADAMYSLASGGMNAGQIIAATEGVLKLAGATLSDMGTAAELTMSTLRQFNIEADKTRRVVNVFGAGIQNSMLNMQRLSDSLSYVGTTAHSVNMSLEETTAALALLHNGGMMASMAGTGLRQVLATLIEPGKELQEALGGVSVEVDGLGAVIARLQSQKLSPRELAKMFDIRALTAAQVLIGQGAVEFDRLTRAVTGTQAAWEMYDRQMNTTRGRWEEVKSALEEALIGTFKALKPVLTEALYKFIDFANKARPAIVKFAQDAAEKIAMLAEKAGEFIGWIRDHKDDIIGWAKGLAVATAGVYALATAVKVVNFVMSVNPLARVIIVLALFAGWLTKIVHKMGGWAIAWLTVQRVTKELGVQIAYAVKRIGLSMSHVAEGAWLMKDNMLAAFQAIESTWQQLAQTMGRSMQRVGQSLANPMTWVSNLMADQADWANYGEAVAAAFAAKLSEEDRIAFENFRKEHQLRVAQLRGERNADMRAIEKEFNERAAAVRGSGGAGGLGSPDYVMSEDEMRALIGYLGPGLQIITENAEQARQKLRELKNALREVRVEGSGIPMEKWFQKDEFQFIVSAARSAADGIADAFGDAVFRTRSLLDGLASVGRSIFGMLFSGVLRIALASIGGPGGFFASVFGFPAVGKAAGGPVLGGVPYLVGEKGPELFVPRSPGRIVPNYALAGAGGVGAINVSVALTVPRGSMLIADNSMAVKQWARVIGRTIATEISRTYKE